METLKAKVKQAPLWPAAAVACGATAYYALSRLVVALWSYSPITMYGFPWRGRFEAYARWDAAWYYHIAQKGYYYNGPGVQSAVAFFPAYPTAMRATELLTGDIMVAGVIVTVVAGAGAMLLLHRWTSAMLGAAVAPLTVVLLLVFPYSYYLLGVIYSDALFLAAAVAAFLLLELRRPWLAALAGAIATSGRPVGLALSFGLIVRSLEIHGVIVTGRYILGRVRGLRIDIHKLTIRALAPAASVAGICVYSALLWWRFGEPLAFMKVGNAPAWGRDLSLRTLVKVDFWQTATSGELTVELVTTTTSAALTLIAVALLPKVLWTLGPGYFSYSALVVGIPMLTAPAFLGMGRYLLAAFPIYAVAAHTLHRHTKIAAATVAVSAAALIGLSTLFIRGYLLA